MGKKVTFDRKGLMNRLEKIEYSRKDEADDTIFNQMHFSSSLLKLTKIDPESEYRLCRSVAEHLLETVPEPYEVDDE